MTCATEPETAPRVARIPGALSGCFLVAVNVACFVVGLGLRIDAVHLAMRIRTGNVCEGTGGLTATGWALHLILLGTFLAAGLSIVLAVAAIVWRMRNRSAPWRRALTIAAALVITAFALFNVWWGFGTMHEYLDPPTSCPSAPVHVPAR